jgi:uncharacterized cupredoxin-like copper-binding protein
LNLLSIRVRVRNEMEEADMRSKRLGFAVGAVLLAAPILAACGGDGVRTIEIRALDDLKFDPSEVRVEVGERVRFVVTNDGQIPHEFIVGDEQVQEAHEMAAEEGMEHGAAMEAMAVLELEEPDESEEVTLTFDEPGEILYGCHEPGHYAAGMVGTITVG